MLTPAGVDAEDVGGRDVEVTESAVVDDTASPEGVDDSVEAEVGALVEAVAGNPAADVD